jgi:hypothetical protein
MTGTPSRRRPAARNGSARVASPPGHPGASSSPPLAADAAAHTGTSPRCGHRAATAAAAPVTADTAAATSPGAPAGITGSGAIRASSTVKNTRTGSARPANRRSHPRTVAAGRPSSPAIFRCPAPAAAASSAVPITSPPSARRDRHHAGSSTCVTPHTRHRDLRGTSTTSAPARTRTRRGREFPHPPSTPPHPGQHSSPPASCRSTTSPSPFTVSTTPPRVTRGPPVSATRRRTGGPHPYPTCSPSRPAPKRTTPASAPCPSATSVTQTRHRTVITGRRGHPPSARRRRQPKGHHPAAHHPAIGIPSAAAATRHRNPARRLTRGMPVVYATLRTCVHEMTTAWS